MTEMIGGCLCGQVKYTAIRDDLKYSTTLAVVVNRLSGTFARNAGRQFSRISASRRA